MHRNLRQSVVVLVTTFASLAIMASPATATISPHAVTITGGAITFHSTTSSTFVGSTGGTGCSATATATVNDVNHTIDFTAFSIVAHAVLTANNIHYVVTITRAGSTSGTFSGGSFSSPTLQLTVVIRAAADNSSTNFDCTPTGGVLCTLRVTTATAPLHFAGTYTGSPPSTGSNSTSFASTTGTNLAAITLGIGTCQAPFATFNGGVATATLTGTF